MKRTNGLTARMIHAGISRSESMTNLSNEAALLFTWMIPNCDDQGRIVGSPGKLRMLVIPGRSGYTASDTEGYLSEMAREGMIIRYEIGGRALIQIKNWREYQGTRYAYPSDYPPPPGWEDRINTWKDELARRKPPEIPGDSRRLPESPLGTGTGTGKGTGTGTGIIPLPPVDSPFDVAAADDGKQPPWQRCMDAYRALHQDSRYTPSAERESIKRWFMELGERSLLEIIEKSIGTKNPYRYISTIIAGGGGKEEGHENHRGNRKHAGNSEGAGGDAPGIRPDLAKYA